MVTAPRRFIEETEMRIPSELMACRNELRRNFNNHHYERSDGGILFPKIGASAGGLFIGGVVSASVNGGPEEISPNLITNEGLAHIVSVIVGGGSQVGTWYIAPFGTDVSPAASWTAANFTATAGEIAAGYDETTRVEYDETASGASADNSASKATFTANTAITVRGIGILSVANKSATTGKLLAAARLATDKDLTDDETIDIQYTLTAANGS